MKLFLLNIYHVTIPFFVSLITPHLIQGQTLVTFDNLFDNPDSYWDGSDLSGGFEESEIFFPNHYDTTFGGYWASGWALSTMTDSVTSGFLNHYSAKSGGGAAGSTTYAVAYQNDFLQKKPVIRFVHSGSSEKKAPLSIQITNSTYTYNSMRDGDGFAKQFGGNTGDDPDYFKLCIYGYADGIKLADSISFFLADYRFEDSQMDYLVKDWTALDLSVFPPLDSLTFRLFSSDVGVYGMNTPAYFCLDHLTFDISSSKREVSVQKPLVFPNPANEVIHISGLVGENHAYKVINTVGEVVKTGYLNDSTGQIPLISLFRGNYFLVLEGLEPVPFVKFN